MVFLGDPYMPDLLSPRPPSRAGSPASVITGTLLTDYNSFGRGATTGPEGRTPSGSRRLLRPPLRTCRSHPAHRWYSGAPTHCRAGDHRHPLLEYPRPVHRAGHPHGRPGPDRRDVRSRAVPHPAGGRWADLTRSAWQLGPVPRPGTDYSGIDVLKDLVGPHGRGPDEIGPTGPVCGGGPRRPALLNEDDAPTPSPFGTRAARLRWWTTCRRRTRRPSTCRPGGHRAPGWRDQLTTEAVALHPWNRGFTWRPGSAPAYLDSQPGQVAAFDRDGFVVVDGRVRHATVADVTARSTGSRPGSRPTLPREDGSGSRSPRPGPSRSPPTW